MENYMIWVWLAVFIITFIVEAATTDLVSIWFSLGAILGIILSLIDGIPYYVEIICFVTLSLLLLIVTRPFVKKLQKNVIRKTNADEFIGKVVTLLDDLSADSVSSIKINDVLYSAILPEGNQLSFNKGEKVQIIAVKGNKVVVMKKIDNEINI